MSAAESFNKSAFAKFIGSTAGRALRVMAGVAVFYWGFTQRTGTLGIVAMVAGAVMFAAGAFGMCFISALLGGPFMSGKAQG